MAIRESLHPQLAELWTHEPMASGRGMLVSPNGMHIGLVGGHSFAAVVHDKHSLRAELEILMLHAAPPGHVIAGADIDNRLKTLFDALSWPTQTQQIPPGWSPAPSAQPLHCLLQDDRHITRVSVETDRWLGGPGPEQARLVIRVVVWALEPTNVGLRMGIL
jgi:hypothetical protein